MKIYKRLAPFVLVLTLCIQLLPIQVLATSSDFVISDGVLTKYTGTESSVDIPDGVTSIGWEAFSGRTGLTSVTIPSSVTSIQSRAFWHTSLVSIEIPSSVTSIGEFVFSIETLTEISVAPDNPRYSSKDGVLYDKNQTALLVYPRGKADTTFKVPDSVTEITKWAYYDGNLTSISIPSSITSIGEGAFYNKGIKDVYYSGDKEHWEHIEIDDLNPGITSATMHYNSYKSSNGNADSQLQKSYNYISGQFTDVPQSSWYYEGVRTAYEYGLMSGVGNASFNPSGNLTVAEAISIACRIHNLYYGNNVAFKSGNPWYKPYVDYALSCNIIASEYDYNAPVCRADFALFISNALSDEALQPINDISELDIPDVCLVSPVNAAANALRNSGVLSSDDAFSVFNMLVFFENQMGGYSGPKDTDLAIYRLYRAGIVAGNDEYGTYTPTANITRSAVAAIISRVVEPSQRLHITLSKRIEALVPLDQLFNLTGIRKKASKEELAQAYEVAKQIVEPLSNLNIEAQLCGIALALGVRNSKMVTYSMSAPHYNDPYGFFVTGYASCAGCTRATGLCLNMLGIPYEHINEDQYGHQWARINVNGAYWICDAFGLYCGPEEIPYQHPTM